MTFPSIHHLYRWMRILLIPVMLWVIFGFVIAGSKLSLKIGYTQSLYLIGIGFGTGIVIFSVISPFMKLYVIGHELTHWVTAKVFRRQTGKLRIGSTQGSVSVQQPNIWIILAPYFFPFYTVIWILFIKVISIWYMEKWLMMSLYLGIGITYAYHIFMTMLALTKEQTDLKVYGYSFSLCLIILINFSIVYCGLSFYSDSIKYSITLLRDSHNLQWAYLNKLFSWIKQIQI